MKIGIVYGTNREEATVKIVEWMKEALIEKGHDVIAAKPDSFNTRECDAWIAGTAVYAFSVKRTGLYTFLKQHKADFTSKPLALFLVCGADRITPDNPPTGNALIRWLKRRLINPDKHMTTLASTLENAPADTAIFKGYQEKGDADYQKFTKQESAVRQWVLSVAD